MSNSNHDKVYASIKQAIDTFDVYLKTDIDNLAKKRERLKNINIEVFTQQIIAEQEAGIVKNTETLISCITKTISE